MKRFLSAGLTAVVIAVGLATAPVQQAAAADCTPRTEMLPRLEDGRAPGNYGPDTVFGLGGRGRLAVGQTDGRPAYWQDGKLKLVPLPAGYRYGQVTDVNAFGLMVGVASGPSANLRPFRYWTGQRSITFYPKGYQPEGINDEGRVVVDGGDGTAYEYWNGTQIRRILRVPGGTHVRPTAINNGGQIVGAAYVDGHEIAVSWAADVAAPGRPLKPVADPDLYNYYVLDIDQRGRAVGYQSFVTNDVYRMTGLYWSSTNAPVPDTIDNFTGISISPTTKVVAGLNDSTGLSATIWRGSGAPILLPTPPSASSSSAYTIDDDGRVGGRTWEKERGYPTVWHCTQGLPASKS